jgi:hypothetical protein
MLVALAAATAIAFIALYLGGYPWAFAHERMALLPLIGGLGSAVLEGYRRGALSRSWAGLAMALLVAWVLFLRIAA